MANTENRKCTDITVVKLVLETASPMAINSGLREVGFDNQLVRDVNGLPTIPATAFAGVWRHLATSTLANKLDIDHYFGFTSKSQSNGAIESAAARIVVSNGRILDSNNQVVENYQSPEKIADDPILSICLHERPMYRERVSINDRGVAKDTGKFDQILLPKGIRFALTIKVKQALNSDLDLLLGVLNDKRFALGSSTRNGLGQIKVVNSDVININLAEGIKAGERLQSVLSQPCSNNNDLAKPQYHTHTLGLLATVPLQGLDYWRCGRGSELLGSVPSSGSVGIMTYSETCVRWVDNKAKVTERIPVFCGSSIKGILAHRIAYHYRRHTDQWAESMATASHDDWQTRPQAVNELFGYATDGQQDDDGAWLNKGQAGRLVVLDSIINYDPENITIRTHNTIDRFTGGVRKGALYSEELIYQPTFTVHVYITPGEALPIELQHAIRDTFDDIRLGMLSMGAGSGRGSSAVQLQSEQTMTFNSHLLGE
ncbi:RAMP superfamily CRISPR-associated protein [Thalassotalea ponticola]|uniref:RAMP superfamily CRISPR-associated protein n=1 Tax=Thalassotalea ponticola TaxID=1523392 RepID=UPI0025B5E037|nr:RAMP superfamily CRISPR-associated protein [Thalassotalea ponticola]MDN3651359.1 RAMP superfamily CRISPR-associated protein [Thalassotalea ponticola]